MIVSVHHPRLPFGGMWLPLLSILVYAATCVAARVMERLPQERLRVGRRGCTELDRMGAAALVMGLARAALCSGSYVLCDVDVPSERVRVRIRLI